MNTIALECVLELGTVELEHAPILREAFGTDVISKGGGNADVTDDAFLRVAPFLLDRLVEALEFFDLLVRLIQLIPSISQRPFFFSNAAFIVTVQPRLKLLDMIFVDLDHDALLTDFHLNRPKELVEGAGAEQLDTLARRTSVSELVVFVCCCSSVEEHMVTGDTVEPPSLNEKETHGALGIGLV